MKKEVLERHYTKLIFIALFLFFISSNNLVLAANIPTDYAAYYKFENNANDETGKYNGTLNGNAVYVAGKKGQALKLDGDNDYMQSSYGYRLNPSVTPLTYSLWVKHYATGGDANPIFLSQSASSALSPARMFLAINSGKWAMGIADSSSSAPSSISADNNWHLITVTMNGTVARMYIDGVDTGHTKAYPSYVFGSYLRLGVYSSTLEYDFAGEIDEALVYNRALSLSEIQQIYCSQGGSAAFCSAATPTCSDSIKNQDETDVDCGGTKCSKCANGKICALNTDCTSNKCTSGKCAAASACTNDAGCTGAGSFCQGNVPYTCSSGTDGCFDRVNGSSCGSSYYCSSGSCLAQTCAGTDTSCGTYPNCVNCNNNDGCSGSSYRNYYCSSNTCIYSTITKEESLANNNCNDGKDNDCDGKTDAQDSGCVESPAPPASFPKDYVAYYKFENNANDETGKYNGTVNGNAVYVAGKKGQALKLDGDNDYMQSTYGSGLKPAVTPHTYSLWVKHYATGGNANPIFLSQSAIGSGLSPSRMFLAITSGKWAMGIADSSSSDPSNISADNNWHLVTLTMNGTTAKMYIDGVDINYFKPYWAFTFNSYLRLGVYSSTLEYDFAGEIDEAIVYQRVLSLSEIQQIYCSQGGSASFCQAQPATPTCYDSIKNQDETDVDCGGTKCSKCANGKVCALNTDCTGGNCTNKKCVLLCTNDAGCTGAGSFCDGSKPYTCSLGTDGCLDRVNGTACESGEVCEDGACKSNKCLPSSNCFYVSVTGAGSHNGTTGNEMNLSEAIDYANARTNEAITFSLKNGSYGNFSFINSPARTAWLTWKSKDDPVFNKVLISNSNKRNAYMKFEGLTIHPPQPNPMPPDDGYRHIIGNVFDISRADNVQVNNCTLIGYNKYLTEYAFNVQESINVTLYGNDVSNTLGGFYIKSSNKTKIINNYLHDVAEGSGIRILERNFYTLIEGNHIYGQDGGPEEAYFPHYGDWHVGSGMSIRSDNMIIRNNTVHNGYSQGLMFYTDGLPVYNNILLENNVFYDTGRVALYNCGKNISVIHNTFIGAVNVEGTGQTRVIQRYTGSWAALNVYNAAGYDYSGIKVSNNLHITPPIQALPNKGNNFIWTSEEAYLGTNDIRAIWIDSSNVLHGNPNIFENVGFRETTPEYSYARDGIKPFFVNAGFYTQNIEWDPKTTYYLESPIKYRPNGKYYLSLQSDNLNNSPINSPSWWKEDNSLSFWEKDRKRGDLDYHPLINSKICDGSLSGSTLGVPWAGALPCVCTNNSQCEQVYGSGSTCNLETGKCEGASFTAQSASSTPAEAQSSDNILVRAWNWFKGFLTGNTIKEITGYFMKIKD